MREPDRGAESRIVMPYTVVRSRSGAGRALTKGEARAGGVRDKRVALRLDIPAPMKGLNEMHRNAESKHCFLGQLRSPSTPRKRWGRGLPAPAPEVSLPPCRQAAKLPSNSTDRSRWTGVRSCIRMQQWSEPRKNLHRLSGYQLEQRRPITAVSRQTPQLLFAPEIQNEDKKFKFYLNSIFYLW